MLLGVLITFCILSGKYGKINYMPVKRERLLWTFCIIAYAIFLVIVFAPWADSQEEKLQYNSYNDLFLSQPHIVPTIPIKLVRFNSVHNYQLSNQLRGYEMAKDYGYSTEQWRCFDLLIVSESAWDHLRWNAQGSSAYGIGQSLPSTKMATHGDDYMTNPAVQIAWTLDYIKYRPGYGTACNAWQFKKINNWY